MHMLHEAHNISLIYLMFRQSGHSKGSPRGCDWHSRKSIGPGKGMLHTYRVGWLHNFQEANIVTHYSFLSRKALITVTYYSLKKEFYIYIYVCVTGPGKTGLIYTKYTCLYYGTYLPFCMCYPKSVSFIAFLMDFYTYDDILHTIWITDKKLLHFKLS